MNVGSWLDLTTILFFLLLAQFIGFHLVGWMRKRREMQSWERVPVEGLFWPELWKIGEHERLPVIHFRVRYMSPFWTIFAHTLTNITCVALLFALVKMFERPLTYPHYDWMTDNLNVVLVCAVVALLAGKLIYLAWVNYGWKMAGVNQPLEMTFTAGQVEWKSGERYPVGIGRKIKGNVIGARLERFARVRVPHSKGPDELRKRQEAQARKKMIINPIMYYQQCSEVIIDVGPNRATPLVVAEFADDEFGETANCVLVAIALADDLARGKRRIGDEPAGTADTAAKPRRRGMFT